MMTKHRDHPWAHFFLLFFGILCISWSAILVKLAGISGFGSGFYRLFFGTLGIIPVWLYFKKPIKDLKGVKTAILCGILFGCDIAAWNSSIVISKASISTLLANLAPVWVGIFSILLIKEKPKKIFWLGTVISMLGVAIIIGLNEIIEVKFNLGNILAIIASIFYAAYIITVRKGRNSLDTFSFTTISMMSSTVVLGLFCLFTATPLWGFSTQTWLSLGALGLVPQLLGWLAINQSLGHINPATASVSLLSQSVFTALFSIPVLGEMLTLNEIGGAVIVLTGIYIVIRK